ncbi:two-partner secretion domain-containing protein [Nostoc sp.]|uniref:two-partner secretion domain-containing protein n=1 Tax=Nostoc sp. TaxID=1180 RepID=UPI003B5EB67B
MRGVSNDKPRSVYAFLFILISGLLTSGMMRSAIAQVTSDATTNTVVNQSGNNYTIINGIEKGNNLFHSFSNFSVPTGGSANFDLINTPNIATIFSRVTGGNVSNIDGLISTLNSNNPVSLFLINPAGIVFGKNARLNIGGSFLATTGNSIKFADGTEFSAVNASSTPLLTISVPVGLQLGANAGAIQVQGADLRVQTGQTLALVGSQIDMTGAKLTAPDGHIELWALQNAGIQMENQAQWQLTSPADTANWGTISLKQSSLVDASGINGGGINIRGRGLTMQDGSNISSTTSAGQGKGITIQTTEFADFLGLSAPGLAVGVETSVGNQLSFFPASEPPTTGQAGNITIETNRLRLANGAVIQSSTSGNNSIAGDITIHAADVDMVGNKTSFSFGAVNTIGTFINFGNNNQSGRVTVDAQRIRLLDGDRISSSLLGGNGTAGEVSIRAVESLEIRGANPSGVTSAVLVSIEGGATGQGGRITIDAGSLILANGGTITSGLAGAKNTLFGSIPGAQGTAGSIDIRAREVQVSDPLIDAYSNSITGITASVGNGAVGSGGTINLTADSLRVFNGGQITSSSQGQGSAGSVNLRVNNIDVQGISQPLADGRILPSTITASAANAFTARSVNITADSLRVRDGAEITVSNSGTGDAGNLNINARNIFLDNGASLRAEANGGSRGNIRLQASDFLLLRRGSRIITNARGASTGGNIEISAGSIIGVPTENSDISANAVLGQGGNIQITTQGFFGLKFRPQLTPESDITASSQFGVSGTVQVNTIGVDPNSGLVELPVNVTDPSQQIATGCANSESSRFVATGRGGVPQNPTQQVANLSTWDDVRDLSAYRKTGDRNAQIPASLKILIEATTWHRNAKGKVELIATQPDAHVQQPLTCAAVPKS